MATLNITNVQVYPIKGPNGKLRALARVSIEDQLQLTGLRVYDGVHGLFVCYPNDTSRKGEEYHQIYYPLTSEFRANVEKAILEEYDKVKWE